MCWTNLESGMTPEVETWLWYVDKALADMCAVVAELGDERANRRPDLPGANSPYAILTHCCGVMTYWAGEVVADRPIERDRAAEFVASGPVADLLALVERTREQLGRDVEAVEWNVPPRGPVQPDDRDRAAGLTQGGTLLHIYEELAQHLGQLEITRDVLLKS
jgi:hypothetical protein